MLVTFLKNLPQDQYEIDLLLNLYSGKYLTEVPAWVHILYLNKGEMITTNRLQDLPRKAFRVLYQKILKTFPKILYRFVLKGKKYDCELAAIHGMRDEILNSPLKFSKKIVWIHNDLKKTEFHHYTREEFRKFFGFDKIMVISDKIQKDFEDAATTEKEKQKIVRIYNPLDTEDIILKSQEPKARDQAEHSIMKQPTFVSVGTVFPQKGFDRLLKMHKKLLDEGFEHKILIIGDGYDFENIKKLQEKLKVTESSSLLGFTDNPYPFIKKADFYILSSRYEGFPTVLFEALTLKKNIIATDVSGVREMLAEGRLGLIVDNSEAGIYDGMKTALRHPEMFAQYEDNLRDYQMPFSLKNSVEALRKIIEEQ